jgi:hypothetical protein
MPLIDIDSEELDDGGNTVDADLGGGHNAQKSEVGSEEVVDIGLVDISEDEVETEQGHRTKDGEHVSILERHRL